MAESDDRLDRVLKHLDSIHEKCDTLTKTCDSMKTRMDAMEEEHKKDRKDSEEWRARADAAEKERRDKEEKERADAKVRADAEAREKEEKERKDREEKERADAASAAAAAAAAAANTGGVAEKLAALERRLPAMLSDDDKHKYADVQMRCDRAYQAWGEQARPPLNGESLADYRVRLLKEIQKHSKSYKDSNLGILVADSAAFSIIENTIINDAVEASNKTVVVGAPLREQVSRSESGHTVRRFIGDPHVTWAPFMGGAVSFGKIVRDHSRRSH